MRLAAYRVFTRSRFWAASAFALIAAVAPRPLAAQAIGAPPERLVTVSGEGEVQAVPDEARLSAGVVTQAATAADALSTNRRSMNSVLAALQRQGIPEKSIQTSGFFVTPQYDFSKDAPRRVTGYQVSNTVTVIIDDLAKLGPTIDALVSSGANSMNGVAFLIHDSKPLLKQARESAIKDAMDRARVYADAAGVDLGRVVSIGEGEASMPRPVYRAFSLAAAMAPPPAPTPTAAGEETVSAEVTMTFEIK